MKKLLSNKYVRYILILLGGVFLGAIFYPTKSIEREIEQKYQSKIERIEEESKKKEKLFMESIERMTTLSLEKEKESKKKISSLRIENTQLKQKVKETKLKIIKPDGTIVEKSFKESETESISRVVTDIKKEFNTKVKSIEKKWESVHEKRVESIKERYDRKLKEKEKVIAELKKKETIKINERNFGIALGMMSNRNYYSNISYDIYGPFYLNLQLESDRNFDEQRGGFGIGMRF